MSGDAPRMARETERTQSETVALMRNESTAAIPLSEKAAWDYPDLNAAGVGSRTTVWRLEKADPSFPRAVLIRGNKRWIPGEVREWLARQAPRAGRAA